MASSALPVWYLDADGDGFGGEIRIDALEAPSTQYTPARGDCNDDDAGVHPGAPDLPADQVDSDCGGTDAPEPHVGFNASSFASIQNALDAAPDHVTVWVGPGTYLEAGITFKGKPLRLASSHPAGETLLDGHGAGPVVDFSTGEGRESVLDGFTITGGDNRSDGDGYGGGLYISSSPTVIGCVVWQNIAYYGGGAYIRASQADPLFKSCVFTANTATFPGGTRSPYGYGEGGGVDLEFGSAAFEGCSFSGNYAATSGGGLSLRYCDVTMTRCVLAGNSAPHGGGADFTQASATITNCIVAGNRATSLGGGLVTDAPIAIRNTILAYNLRYDLFSSAEGADVRFSDLYSPYGKSHNLANLEATNLETRPELVKLTSNQDFSDDDYHLRPGSGLRDMGDPALPDDDGSASDIGVYGGPGGDQSYYEDGDQDGLYDGWERLHALDPGEDDSSADPDGDGLSSEEEFTSFTDPQQSDSDGDGADDGLEVQTGTEPTDWYVRPGLSGFAVARVPEDFLTVQAAVDAIISEGSIEVGPGTWPGNLRIDGRHATLTGREGSAHTVLKGSRGCVVSALQSYLELAGFTVTGGVELTGGGLFLGEVDGSLEDLIVTGNTAYSSGGGLALSASSPSIHQCRFIANQANAVGCGGGAVLIDSSPVISDCTLADNVASTNGGGFCLWSSSPTMTHCSLTGNEGGDFGGGAMYLSRSSPLIQSCRLAGNSAEGNGSSMRLEEGSSPTISSCVVVGASRSYSSRPNSGILVADTVSSPRIQNSILFDSVGYALYVAPGSVMSASSVQYSDLFSRGVSSSNLPVDATNSTLEPQFLAYDVNGLPADFHLAVGSPLVNTGDSALLDLDGSRSDPGCYGGPSGGTWDLDGDGYFDYFWPGTLEDVPPGIEPGGYESADLDASQH